jgi:uncharacterized membrane protein YebE (DUF533 family)
MLQVFPITKEAVQTIFNGALGAMTFGAYSQFQNEKLRELNNQLQEQKMKDMMDEREKKFTQMLKESRRWPF